MTSLRLLTTILPLFVLSMPVLAERADRDKPVNIVANKVTVDDRNKVHVFEGNVVLTQGTLTITGDKMVVTQDADGFQRGSATGNAKQLATFRQKRDNSTEYVEGEAERIEYDSRTERAKLFRSAKVSSGGDEVKGHYIEYDSISENYLVTNAPGDTKTTTGDNRVTTVITPKQSSKAE